MDASEIIVYGIAGINSIALLIGSNMLSQVNKKLDRLGDSDDRIVGDIHDLDKRVTRIETVNDERLKLIEEIHKNLQDLHIEMREMRTSYESEMRKFYETYDLKKKE